MFQVLSVMSFPSHQMAFSDRRRDSTVVTLPLILGGKSSIFTTFLEL